MFGLLFIPIIFALYNPNEKLTCAEIVKLEFLTPDAKADTYCSEAYDFCLAVGFIKRRLEEVKNHNKEDFLSKVTLSAADIRQTLQDTEQRARHSLMRCQMAIDVFYLDKVGSQSFQEYSGYKE